MSILDIRKTLIYEFWYDYIKSKYGDRAKLCYINLIPKEQTKAIEGRSDNENNQSIAAKIFNDLIKKRKSITNELYENVDMNKVYLSRQVLLKM